MEIDFLGCRYRLSKKDGAFFCGAADGQETGLDARSILCYYALSPARGEPLFDFCLLDYFSRGICSSNRAGPDGGTAKQGWDGRLKDALSTALRGLSPDAEAACFAAAAHKLGMTPAETSRVPRTWDFRLLPKVPVQVRFDESDDEYPPGIRVYYDKTAILVFKFEPLAVLHSCFMRTLIRSLNRNMQL